MNNWRNYCNYRRKKNGDGTYSFFIVIDGKYIEVSEAVYREYALMARKMKYMELDIKRNRTKQNPKTGKQILDKQGQPILLPEREVSLDKLIEENWEFPIDEPTPDMIVLALVESSALYKAITMLDAEEKEIIQALFFNNISARAYANQIGIAKSTIGRRREKTLARLRELMTG